MSPFDALKKRNEEKNQIENQLKFGNLLAFFRTLPLYRERLRAYAKLNNSFPGLYNPEQAKRGIWEITQNCWQCWITRNKLPYANIYYNARSTTCLAFEKIDDKPPIQYIQTKLPISSPVKVVDSLTGKRAIIVMTVGYQLPWNEGNYRLTTGLCIFPHKKFGYESPSFYGNNHSHIINPDQLEEKVIKIETTTPIEDAEEADRVFEMLKGDDLSFFPETFVTDYRYTSTVLTNLKFHPKEFESRLTLESNSSSVSF